MPHMPFEEVSEVIDTLSLDEPVRRFRDSKPPSMRYQNGGLPIGESALQLYSFTALSQMGVVSHAGRGSVTPSQTF